MPKEIARPEGSAYDLLKAADTPTSKYEAGRYAVEAVEVPGFVHPVPRFMFDLPWNDDDDEIVAGILANIAAADNLEAATAGQELRDPGDLCGERVRILGVAARKSDLDDAKWGAYVTLTVSVNDGPPEVLNTGAGQVAVTAWRLYCDGALPANGTFVKYGTPKPGRSQPLGFQVEGEF